jgi:hypothetical protein
VASSRSSSRSARRGRLPKPRRLFRPVPLGAEELEQRTVPSAVQVAVPSFRLLRPFAGSSPSGYVPAQILHAYGFDQLSLDGTGQTIAIVDAFHDPNIEKDLATFDRQFGLPDPPSFRVLDQNGNPASGAIPTDPSGGWEVEESLDVEWAHAIAPKANIILVEANSPSSSDLLAAVDTARNAKGVVAISMSWGGGEWSGEGSFDSHFTTPAGHNGVTFLASSGDNGTPAGWPAVSPNVVSVGGTTLNLDASNNRNGEVAWRGSGGGYSSFYKEPAYESTYAASPYVQNTLGNTVLLNSRRGNPDVSYDADPNTGFAVYDSYPYQGAPLDWVDVGGTSASAPQWAGLIALVDQGRGAALGSLDGLTQTLPALYQLGANSATYGNDFFDVTLGSNGQATRAGYDLVTGLGSPRANNLIPDLEKYGITTTLRVTPSTDAPAAGSPFSVTVTAQNSSGQTLTTYTGTVHFTATDHGSGVSLPPDYTFTAADNGSHTFTDLVTLVTAGSQTVTATDTGNSATTGKATVTVGAAAASSLTLSAPATANQGAPFGVTVTAKDPYGNTATGYAGTVHFTTSDTDPGVALPQDYTFGASDNGSHTFANGVTLVTLGDQTVTATDLANPALTATATVNVKSPSAATHLSVSAPSGATAGAAFGVTVTALDANNNTATGYLGTVHFKTSDAGTGVALPQDYTFTVADKGGHTFTDGVTLVTAGSQTVTATDVVTGSITGTATVNVTAAAASRLSVTGFPSPVNAGTAGTFTVTALDPYGNTATGYAGTVRFSSSDTSATLPGNSTLTSGVGTFTATLRAAGTQSLTATDTAKESIRGTQSGIQVVANLPTVTGLSPNSGSTAGGFGVMISGTNLSGATAVYFGTTKATIMGGNATMIGVTAPAHAVGVVDVTVVTPAGTSGITQADKFTYVGQSSGPTVTGVNPNSGPTAGGYQVAISGTNFTGATAVYFGSTPATIQMVSANGISVLAPTHTTGTVDVTVVTPAGTSPITAADQFTYTGGKAAGPIVYGTYPHSGPTSGGYQVIIYGANFDGAFTVYFGATRAVIQTVTSGAISVLAPSHAPGVVDVTVTTPVGTSGITTADRFTYLGSASRFNRFGSVMTGGTGTTGGFPVNSLLVQILLDSSGKNVAVNLLKKGGTR